MSGKCLSFDGSNDFVNYTGLPTLFSDWGSTSFSMSTWFKTIDNATDRGVFGSYAANDIVQMRINPNSDNKLSVYMRGSASCGWVSSNSAVANNQWYYATMVYDRTNLYLYVNGQLQNSTACNITSVNLSTFSVGKVTGAASSFTGFIDEPKIYPYARTAAQVKLDYDQGAQAVLGSTNTVGGSPGFLSNGLVGYWKLDESSSTAADSSGNSNSGTWNGTAAAAAGKFGNGISLDGDSDYVSIGDTELISTAFTTSVWFKPDNVTQTGPIISKYTTTGDNRSYIIRLDSNDYYFALSSDGTSASGKFDQLTVSNVVSANVWQLATVTYDGTTVKMFLNGSEVGSFAHTGGVYASGTASLLFGNQSTNYFDGTLDETRIYNRALSAAEVRQLYSWAPGPIGRWNLDEGTGTSAADDSGNSNTGTITDPTWINGKFGKALSFNGTSAEVNIGDTDNTSGMLTISAWIKPNTVSGGYDAIYGESGFGFYNFNGVLTLWTSAFTGGTGTLTVNQWQHVAATFDSSTDSIYFYINGTRVYSKTNWTGTVPNDANTEFIGSYNGSQEWFSGLIDDMRIYNYARTAGQIMEDMNAGHPVGGSPEGSQVIYYKFDEQQGSTANDTVGNQNGTVTSASWLTKASCKINGCLSFDAAGEVVTIATANDSVVDFNSSETFSGSAWVYVTTMPGSGEQDAIIAKWDDTGNLADYKLYVENDDADTTGNFEVQIYDESASQAITASQAIDQVAVNTWYHVSFTFNGGTAGAAGDLKLYVGGKYTAQNAANTSFLGLEDKASDFTIGEYDTGDVVSTNTAFTGYIDDVKMYSSALTADQIAVDMNANAALNFGTTANAEAADLSDGAGNAPVAYWNMDEKTGQSTNDTSGNSNTGTLGATSSSASDDPTWATGKYGAGLSFDGSNDYVNITTPSIYNQTQYTISAWIKLTNTTGSQTIYSEGRNASLGFLWFYINAGKIELRDNDGTNYNQYDGSTTLSTGVWHHVLVTRNGNTAANIYLNGKLETLSVNSTLGSGTLPTLTLASVGSLLRSTNASFFNGSIDDVRIYNYARTAAQVAYDYNRGAPVGWWKLDECQGTVANDASGNGNHGTITIGASGEDTVGTCQTSSTAWGSGATGKYGASLSFDGTDDYVDISTTGTNYAPTDKPFSVSSWFKSAASPTVYGRIVNLKSNSSPFHLIYSTDTSYNLGFGGDTWGKTWKVPLPSSNTWHHVAIAYNGNGVTTASNFLVTVDGSSQTLTNAGSIGNVSNTSFIGKYSGAAANEHFAGQIDDVRIYNYALSAAQVRKLFNEGASVRYGN